MAFFSQLQVGEILHLDTRRDTDMMFSRESQPFRFGPVSNYIPDGGHCALGNASMLMALINELLADAQGVELELKAATDREGTEVGNDFDALLNLDDDLKNSITEIQFVVVAVKQE